MTVPKQNRIRRILALLAGVALATLLLANFSNPDKNKHDEKLGRVFEFSYLTTIPEFPEGANFLEIWVPIPRSNFYQRISDVKIETKLPYTLQTDPEYGNKMLYIKTFRADNPPQPLEVKLNFKVQRKLYSVADQKEKDYSFSEKRYLNRFLQPDSLVPIDGEIAAEARKIVSPDQPVLEQARALYDHLVHTMKYDKSGQGWGRGDALYACDVRKGNCTDFHSLFIGMARSLGIPARFVMGFPVPDKDQEGEIPGYHCWAEFFTPDLGWVPIDASEAYKNPELKDFLFGGLDPNRVEFTLGRDIPMVPDRPDKKMNYLIYPVVMVDGREYYHIQNQFSYKDIPPSSEKGSN